MSTDGIPSASFTPPVIAPTVNVSRSKAQTSVRDASARACDQAAGSSAWREAGQNYDVCNMNLAEMEKMTTQLYEAGSISLFDKAVLTFDPTQVPVNGQQLGEDSIRLTKGDAQGRRDWIKEFELQKARAESLGETRNAAVDARMLEVLRRVKAGGAPALNLAV